jgi:hypothetical protein
MTLKSLFAISLCGFLVGCAASFLVAEPRSKYEIKSFDDLLVSNLDSVLSPRAPKTDKSILTVYYDLAIQNGSKDIEYNVTSKGQLQVGKSTYDLVCEAVGALDVKPGKSVVLDCRSQINKDAFTHLKEDLIAKIFVPYSSAKRKGNISFDYLIRIEDLNETR